MKITIYELLGLVKDGKAPKKIKYEGEIWEYDSSVQDYMNEDGNKYLFANIFGMKTKRTLNCEVEIIEEPKKIEKIDEILMIDDLIPPCGENDIKMWKNIIIQQNKINELIDEINNLKEK